MTVNTSNLTQREYNLAQINIALMKAPLQDPIMAEFAAALDEVNLTADNNTFAKFKNWWSKY
ncbi:hypothetical protein CAL7716_052110 [Calothrix sp. PCC 7716]|nr:hypothetical protein CAL7716_052110 [Calothrix sp. PCC 7716]